MNSEQSALICDFDCLHKRRNINDSKNGVGFAGGSPPFCCYNKICSFKLQTCINVVSKAHCNGPFLNLRDRKVLQFIGVPLIKFSCLCNPTLRGRGQQSELIRESNQPHQESWSSSRSKSQCNKDICSFDRNLGFVCKNTELLDLPEGLAIDMDNANTYFITAEAIARSGRHNYKGLRIPLTSGFDWTFLKHNMEHYHDKQLMDYIRFGFPLNIDPTNGISTNATTNHASANKFPEAVSEYIDTELKHGTLIGPFDHPPTRLLLSPPS